MGSRTKEVWEMMNKQRAMEKKKFSLKTKADGSPCLSSREGAWFMSLRTPSSLQLHSTHRAGGEEKEVERKH